MAGADLRTLESGPDAFLVAGSSGAAGHEAAPKVAGRQVPGIDPLPPRFTARAGVAPAGPSVSGVFPPAGPAAGGTIAVIEGTGFSTTAGATTVSFGATAGTNVVCPSTVECVATSPAGAGGSTVDVTVTVASQTSATSSADHFGYGNPCPSGSWAGLPALNRFFNGGVNGDGSCATNVSDVSYPGSNGVPATLEVPASMVLTGEGNLTVASGGSLTLDAGVTLSMSPTTEIAVSGAFNTTGTAQSPVTITSAAASPKPGDWKSLYYPPGSSGSVDHLNISFGGAATAVECCGATASADLVVDQSPVSITNSTISQSSGDGLEVPDANTLTAPVNISNDSFTNNAGAAVGYDSTPQSLTIGSGLSGSGNGTNRIVVNTNSRSFGGTWDITPSPNLPLQINGDLNVNSGTGASLTLEAGTTLYVNGGEITTPFCCGQTPGTINVKGTAQSPVTITSASANPKPGDWKSLYYQVGSSGSVDHLNVSFGGATTGVVCCGFTASADLVVDRAAISITNSTISQSAGDGLTVPGGLSSISGVSISNDSFTNNAGAAVDYGDTPQSLTIGSGLSGSANGQNRIVINANHVFNGTWDITPSPNLPLQINGDLNLNSGTGASLTLEAGSELLMNGGGIFTPTCCGQTAGTITVKGTAQSPVTITSASATPKPGDWKSLFFEPTSTGTVDHLNISYGGATTGGLPGNATGSADMFVYDAAVSITNSTISNSSGDGLDVTDGTIATLSNDNFTNNAGWPLLYSLSSDASHNNLTIGTGLSGSGNGKNRIGINTSDFDIGTWDITPSLNLPLQINGDINVPPAATLTLEAGATLYMNGGGIISGRNTSAMGTVNVNGTAQSPVTITSSSATPKPGDWTALCFTATATGSVDHLLASFGGAAACTIPGNGSSSGELILLSSSPVSVTNSVFAQSSGDDVQVAGGSLPVLHNDTFGAVPSGSYGVENNGWRQGQPQVDATYDDWGDPSGPSGPAGAFNGIGTPVTGGVYFDPWIDESGATVGGTVFDGTVTPPAPIPNALVQICAAIGPPCRTSQTDGQGRFSFGGLGASTYLLQANPPQGSNVAYPDLADVIISQGATSVTQDLTLVNPPPALPDSAAGTGFLGINPAGYPVFRLGEPVTICFPTCPPDVLASQLPAGARVEPRIFGFGPGPANPSTKAKSGALSADYTVSCGGKPDSSQGSMTEHANGDGTSTYSASFTPGCHGDCVIHFDLQYADGSHTPGDMPCYIDPSGVVQTSTGTPVIGATVTLLRSDTPSGPFVAVPDGSAIMSPSNQNNPDMTTNGGLFHWDVLSGYYEITASKSGCTNTGTTGILPVPPPQDGLVITLDCPSGPALPTLTGNQPIYGPAIGGTTVTLAGSNFQSGATATLNGVAATNVSASADGTSLTLTTPQLPSLVGDVNGSGHVDATDALCVLRSVAKLPDTAACPSAAHYVWGSFAVSNPGGPTVTFTDTYIVDVLDVNGDGQYTATDALCILRHVAELPGTPACPAWVTPPSSGADHLTPRPPSLGGKGETTVAVASGGAAATPTRPSGAATVGAPAPVHLGVQPAEVNGAAGTRTTVTLSLDASRPVGAWTIDVGYDPGAVKVVSCQGASGGLCNANYAVGVVRIAGASAAGLSGKQTLATLTIEGIGHGRPGALTLRSSSLTDTDGAELGVALALGTNTAAVPTPTLAPSVTPTRGHGR